MPRGTGLALLLLLLEGALKGSNRRSRHWCCTHRRQRPSCRGILADLLLFIVRVVEGELGPKIHVSRIEPVALDGRWKERGCFIEVPGRRICLHEMDRGERGRPRLD